MSLAPRVVTDRDSPFISTAFHFGGGRLLPSLSVLLLAFTEEWKRRGGEKTMILELLPSSRASTLETNCVCNYSALLHLITELRGNVPRLNFVYIYIYIIYNTVADLKKSLSSSDQLLLEN